MPLTLLDKIKIGIRLRADLAHLRVTRRLQLISLLRDGNDHDSACPVCASSDTATVSFDRSGDRFAKGFCRNCGHLFGSWDQGVPELSANLFKISVENAGQPTQVQLLIETARLSNLERGTYLDFGVGGNVSAFQEAERLMPQHCFMGCDVSPIELDGYFATYGDDVPLGVFDGISSYAVVEHLTDTLRSWTLFNRLLKPMADGGGIMVHAFPSQLHHGFDHWSIQIRTHTCVFSRNSLKRICDATGFELTRADPPRFVGPHYHAVMHFRKSRDL